MIRHQLLCDHKSGMDLRGWKSKTKKIEIGCNTMAEIETNSLDRYLIVISGIAGKFFTRETVLD